LILKKGKS